MIVGECSWLQVGCASERLGRGTCSDKGSQSIGSDMQATTEPHRSFRFRAAARSAAVQGPCSFRPWYRPSLHGGIQEREDGGSVDHSTRLGGAIIAYDRPAMIGQRQQASHSCQQPAPACHRSQAKPLTHRSPRKMRLQVMPPTM